MGDGGRLDDPRSFIPVAGADGQMERISGDLIFCDREEMTMKMNWMKKTGRTLLAAALFAGMAALAMPTGKTASKRSRDMAMAVMRYAFMWSAS